MLPGRSMEYVEAGKGVSILSSRAGWALLRRVALNSKWWEISLVDAKERMNPGSLAPLRCKG